MGARDCVSLLPSGKMWRFCTDSLFVAHVLSKLQCTKYHEHEVVQGAS